jgi:hypothetical protein
MVVLKKKIRPASPPPPATHPCPVFPAKFFLLKRLLLWFSSGFCFLKIKISKKAHFLQIKISKKAHFLLLAISFVQKIHPPRNDDFSADLHCVSRKILRTRVKIK